MGTGYTRNDSSNNIADGNIINASDLDGEFDAIESAMGTSGHTHDGTSAEGGPVTVVGPVQDLVVSATEVKPKTDNTLDLGTSSLQFKDAYFQGTVDTDGIMTAATFEPDGDTAAGDNAAIGYTAAEGLILTGQGSTSDITFKNDADTTVFSIPTGTDDVLFPDNAKAMFGAGSDLQIYHDGTDSIIKESGGGDLQLWGDDIRLMSADGSETMLRGNPDAQIQLYYDNALKLATTSTGIDVTGTVTADGLTVDGTGTFNSNVGVVVSGGTPTIRITETDTTDENTQLIQASGTFRIRTASDDYATTTERMRIDHGTGDISFYEDTGSSAKLTWDASAESLNFADNGKAIFGAGSDLQIYHDGSNSTIRDGGTGVLILQSNQMNVQSSTGEQSAQFNEDSDVKLYYDNSQKFATTSTGIDVTGGATFSGNVGIGTSNPQSVLDLGNGSNGSGIAWGGTAGTAHYSSIWTEYSTASIVIGAGLKGSTTNDNFIYPFTGNYGYAAIELDSYSEDGIKFYTTPNAARTKDAVATKQERMRIDISGNLLVGTTSNSITSAKTQIDSSTSASLGLYNSGNAGYAILYVRTDGTANYLAYWNYQGSTVGSVTTNGSSTAYNTTSDYRLKENVVELTGATERLKQLNPSRFNFIADADTTVDGFLAHEAQAVVPEAVTGTHNEVDDDGNAVMQGIDQAKFVPLLTAALQEAIAKIETLETKVAALEGA